MLWYLKLIIMFFGIAVAFLSLWWVDFNKFVRVDRKQNAIVLYVILSLALGFLIGSLFIFFGDLIWDATYTGP